jgi:hypothetical protein
MARGELERHVCSERGSAQHRLFEVEVLEERRDLVRERGHRVRPHVYGPVGASVAEQVHRDHAIAAPCHLRRQPVVHAPVHEQAVHEDEGALAVAVLVVRDPVAVIAE